MHDGLTEAQEIHAKMKLLRESHLKRLMKKIEEKGSDSLRQRMAYAIQDKEEDPAGRMIRFYAEDVVAAAKKLVPGGRNLDNLEFESINDDDATATFTPCKDGSGVILISDGLSALVHYLSRMWAWSVSPEQRQSASLLAMLKQARQRTSGIAGTHTAIGATLLRYHHIHQRTFGFAAKLEILLEEKSQQLARMMSTFAMQFIIAHEVAHYVLRHDSRPQKMAQIGTVSEVVSSQTNEKEADAFAFEIMASISKESSWPASGLDQRLGGRNIIAIVIATLALEAVEQALFLRTSHTHPRPTERFRYLSEGASKVGLMAITQGFGGLIESVRIGSDFSIRIPSEWWDITYSNERVSKETHTPTYLSVVSGMDTFHSGPMEACRRHISRLVDDGLSLLDQAVAAFDEGHLKVGLEILGLSTKRVGEICDSSQALAFISLQEELNSSPVFKAYGVPMSRQIASVVTTRLLEQLKLW